MLEEIVGSEIPWGFLRRCGVGGAAAILVSMNDGLGIAIEIDL